jgi:hypothetical protein
VLGLAHNTNGGATLNLYHFHCSVKILPISKATSAKRGPAKGLWGGGVKSRNLTASDLDTSEFRLKRKPY